MRYAAGLAMLVVLVLGTAINVSAQSRSRHASRRNDGEIVIVLGSDRISDRRASGPAFCRSRAGHPVHGRAWCWQKGFAPTGVVVRVPLPVAQAPRIRGSRDRHTIP